MKALRFHGNKDLRLDDIPTPKPDSGEVLLRVSGTSICATDIEKWQHSAITGSDDDAESIVGGKLPVTLGHEISGRVEQLNGSSTAASPGDRVIINNVYTCGQCFWCLRGSPATCPNMLVAGLSADGGLAECMTWPASHVIKIPKSISDHEAPLIEPATVAVHAVRRSGFKLGDNVAVIGCGTVGILTLQAYRAAGAHVIAIDIRRESLELAERLGASETIDASDCDPGEALLELTDGIGPDIVTETAGADQTPAMAVRWTRPGGTTVLVGIYSASPNMNFNDIVGAERTVVGSVAASPGDMQAAVKLVSDGRMKIKPLVSAVISLNDAIEQGFQRMLKPEKDVFRIVVSP